jgi:phospholipase C
MHCFRVGLATIAMFQFAVGASLANAAPQQSNPSVVNPSTNTTTPIKHVIVIIGENRSFDHVFATYKPKDGQSVWNLLSEGIVKADGTPGPNFEKAEQKAAVDQAPDAFRLSPDKVPFPNKVLPAPLVGGPKETASYIAGNSIANAEASESGLPPYPAYPYYEDLVSGGTTLTPKTPDTRITNVNALPPGPFQLTNGGPFTYNSYAASPVHRFYQMWQQLDCSVDHATWDNPSGCNARLFPWVEVTVGAGTNGTPQPTGFGTEYIAGGTTTGEGSTAMGFYNVQNGDAPYFKMLADTYSMSDNFHQSVDGGTGANHIMLGHGDAIWFSDGNGHPATPPQTETTGGTTPEGTATVIDEVENPDPLTGTNNWYTQDGYGDGSPGAHPYGGGSYSDCSDPTQSGVKAIVKYLQSLPKPIDPHCEIGHYYLLNNYNPGYFGTGADASTDSSPYNTVFTIPPSSTPSIADKLLAADISWKYYGDQWNDYAGVGTPGTSGYIPPDPYQINYGPVNSLNPLGGNITNADEYCTICNPFQYDTSIMTNAAIRTAHINDINGPAGTPSLFSDIAKGTLPAVSFVKPSAFTDGHPASSKLNLFEGFTQNIINAIQSSPIYAGDTAIFITFDEGGGYYDSGYVQPLDFFGDGTRIPMIVVSPFSKGGHITHNYSDHVSILKFIERNWNLKPVTHRSRDNFPNPVPAWGGSPYVPINGPAISDLFELFDFASSGGFGGH